ncbi:MAG: hypothetical protein ACREGI_01140 [Candidatus Levyibacteriota bacterium]
MKKTVQTGKSSTQKFTEIRDIRENILLLTGGNACLVLKVTAVNFALLSKEEQDAKVYAYASLLNSLSFPIQIVMRSKRVQMLPYISSLDTEARRTTNAKLAENIKKYKVFVENLIQLSSVLDKQFYMVIPYSNLESGLGGSTKSITSIQEPDIEELFSQAKASLDTKSESLLSQIDRLSLHAKVLEGEELVSLCYEMFNQDMDGLPKPFADAMKNLMVKGKQ